MIFVHFIGFLFWLRADGGLALFLFLFSVFVYSFLCQGRILSEMCQTERGRGSKWWLFCFATPTHSPFVWLFVLFGKLYVCMFSFFVALHLYIWGNIVLNTCMAFVVIKIVSLVGFCFCFRFFVSQRRLR